MAVPVILHIPVGAIAFVQREGGGYHAELPLHVTSFDNTGSPVELPPVVLRLDVVPGTAGGGDGALPVAIKIRRGERRLRFILQTRCTTSCFWARRR